MQITNRRLRLVHAALTALSGRTLPMITSDLKVAARLRQLRGLVEDTDAVIRKIRDKYPTPDGSDVDAPLSVKEARQREIDVMLDLTVDVPDFTDEQRITEADLPKALKGATGEENRVGVADIILNLDFLYLQPADPSEG